MPAAGAALPTSDTISWVSAPGPGRHLTFHWAAAYLAGARLPPYHASQCQRHQVLQGPCNTARGATQGWGEVAGIRG